MAKAFTEWTVLPHKPLQKAEDNLWHVEGRLGDKGPRRVMAVARMKDGRLVIHNGIALEEPLMADLEGWGEPAVLVVPNRFHRMDARIFKDRYPKLFVTCPARARKAVQAVVPVDGDYTMAPSDETVRLEHLDGVREREGVLVVSSNGAETVVFNDCLTNFGKPLGGLAGFFMGPGGVLTVPRAARWFIISDKAAFQRHLERLAGPFLKRIIVSHGDVCTDEPADRLKDAAARL